MNENSLFLSNNNIKENYEKILDQFSNQTK